jgi:hypothetical protein
MKKNRVLSLILVFIFTVSILGAISLPATVNAATSTNILNKDTLTGQYYGNDKQWYKDNIPFFECPDATVQQIYYYRWNTYKLHLRNTGANVNLGYVVTEFAPEVGWQSPYGPISCPSALQIYEGRWLKDQRYMNDYINYWFKGPGNKRAYSCWLSDATYARYLVNSDANYIKNYLNDMINNYNGWVTEKYDSSVGLFRQFPGADGMEYSITTLQSSDPFWGVEDYRPTLNAYMYADALAIKNVATMAGNTTVANDYASKAAAIKSNLQSRIWDSSTGFFKNLKKLNMTFTDGRELIGYVPWEFNLPDNNSTYAAAWQQLKDSQGFYATYGPTTAERRHRLFMQDYASGCRWNGPSWPYATSQTLTAMANLLNNYTQSYITNADYFDILKKFSNTQYKSGSPYIAENAHPDTGAWICDAANHSEHYNHSNYCDLIITGLAGLRPRADNTIEVNPLFPTTWTYFCAEDIPYHGHFVTILWNQSGSRYGKGAGLRVYVDNVQVASSASITKLTATIAAPTTLAASTGSNLAGNMSGSGYPAASASYTSPYDNVWEAIDGRIWYYGMPHNRWTCWNSGSATDWFAVDFGSNKSVNNVKLYLFTDGGGCQAPLSYTIQYWNGSAWVDAANQVKSPATPIAGTVNNITFTDVTTQKIRAFFTNKGGGAYTALAEMEIFGNSSTPAPFSDNFDDGNANGWTSYGGTWSVSSGQYNVNSDPGAKSVANGTNFANFTYEADLYVGTGGNNDGIIFRVSNPGTGADTYQGYYAGLNLSGSVVLGKANNNWTQITQTNMTVTANTWYHMKVVANGANIAVYVTDMATPKINVTDASYSTGLIGVRTYNANAKFDNISVY